MLTVTESAISNIKDYLAKNNLDSPVRVTMQSSCSGVGLGLAVDSAKPSDKVFEEGGVTFLVDAAMFASTGTITVDYRCKTSGCGCGGSGGFAVTSEKKLSGGGCGGGSCSSGSCGC